MKLLNKLLWPGTLILLMLLPLLGCGAQSTNDLAMLTGGPAPMLSGMVVAEPNNSPVSGARIILPDGKEIVCDSVGRFQTNLPADSWQITLRATAPGHLETLAGGIIPPQGLRNVTIPLADKDSPNPPPVVTLGEGAQNLIAAPPINDRNTDIVNARWNMLTIPRQNLTAFVFPGTRLLFTLNFYNSSGNSWESSGVDATGTVTSGLSYIQPSRGCWVRGVANGNLGANGTLITDNNWTTTLVGSPSGTAQQWNMIGTPYENSSALADLRIRYNGTLYTIQEASAPALKICGPIMSHYNAVTQGWESNPYSTGTMQPWYGYWYPVYKACELIIPNPNPGPRIASLTPSSGWLGRKVTLTGTGFGAVQGASTVRFNNTNVTTYESWSDTAIVVRVPADIVGTEPPVIANVDSHDSNTDKLFTMTPPPVPPSVDSLNPNAGPVGTTVTVSGNNFGASQIDDSNVFFNGTDAGTVTSWNNTRIVCTVPAGATTGPVTVRVEGQFSLADRTFTIVIPPHIDSLAPNSGHVGDTVTITGSNFGTAPGVSSVTFNGTEAGATTWTNSYIIALVPDGATSGNVVVTVSGYSSNGMAFTVIAPPPFIDALDPDAAHRLETVVVYGSNFGTGGTLTFNGVTATCSEWDATHIMCVVPATATTGPAQVDVEGQLSNTMDFTVIIESAPVISRISPNIGIPGDNITIEGANFGAERGFNQARFNGSPSPGYTLWNDSQIICQMPSGTSTGDATVMVWGTPSNGITCYVINDSNYGTVSGQVQDSDSGLNLAEARVEFEVLSGGNVGEKYYIYTNSNAAGNNNYSIHIPSTPVTMRLVYSLFTYFNDTWSTGSVTAAQSKTINSSMVLNDVGHLPPTPHPIW